MSIWTQFNCWRYHTTLSVNDCIERIGTGSGYFWGYLFEKYNMQNYRSVILSDTQILFTFLRGTMVGFRRTKYLATLISREDGCDITMEFQGEILGLPPTISTADIAAFMEQKLKAYEISEPTDAEQKGVCIFPEVYRRHQAARGIWGLIGLGHREIVLMLGGLLQSVIPHILVVALLYPVLMIVLLLIWLSNYGCVRAKYYIDDSVVVNRVCRKEIAFPRQAAIQTALGEKGLAKEYVILSDRELTPDILRGGLCRRLKKIWKHGFVIAPK